MKLAVSLNTISSIIGAFAEAPIYPSGILWATQNAPGPSSPCDHSGPGPAISKIQASSVSATANISPPSLYPYFSASSPMTWIASRAVAPRSRASIERLVTSKYPFAFLSSRRPLIVVSPIETCFSFIIPKIPDLMYA